jgi:hypothetical protein
LRYISLLALFLSHLQVATDDRCFVVQKRDSAATTGVFFHLNVAERAGWVSFREVLKGQKKNSLFLLFF